MLEPVVALVREGGPFLVTMHRRPDGDALGASLALALALREGGHEVVHFNPDPVPAAYRFLPGAEELVSKVPRRLRFAATFALDAAREDRLGPGLPGPGRRGVLVDVDHHPGPPFGDLPLVDPDAASTGILVYRLLAALGQAPSEAVATCLYASILSDTGSFRYDSTDPESLRVAAHLLENGVRPWEVASRLYESVPESKMRLVGAALSTLTRSLDGRYAVLALRQADLAQCGAGPESTQGIVNYARSVDGVEVAALFLELDGGEVEVVLRSRGNCDLTPLRRLLDARATHNAAGALLDGGLEAARRRTESAVAKLLDGAGAAVA